MTIPATIRVTAALGALLLVTLFAGAAHAGRRDTKAPSTPTHERQVGRTATTATFTWRASRDNVHVAGYRVYLDTRMAGITRGTRFVFRGLRCGTSHRAGVSAFDRAGNRSRRAGAVTVRTASCPVPAAPKPTPQPTTPPSVFLSPTGSDGGPCTKTAPCHSWQRGYTVAKAAGGGVVQLAGGSYSDVQLNGATSSGKVTFVPAPGASVSSAEFRTNGVGNVEVDSVRMDVYINGDAQNNPAKNVVLRNDSMQYFFIVNADGIQVLGGDAGGTDDGASPTIGSGDARFRVKNVLVDGMRFHDVTRNDQPNGHVQCLFLQESSNVTIQNSTFANCTIMDLYVHEIGGGGNPDHVTLLDNTFGPVNDGYYSVFFNATSGESFDSILVKGNAFGDDAILENSPGSTITNFKVCGNTGHPLKTTASSSGVSRTC